MQKCNLKHDTMNESKIQRALIYPIYPRDSKNYSDKRFVKKDNGSMGGTHWVCFYLKEQKSFHFDSLGGKPHKNFTQTINKTNKISQI